VRFRRPGKLKVTIEIAPLVDVVFLLVIFFAVSTTFLEKSGMKLDLPSSTSHAEREASEITVNLAADGRMEFMGDQVTADILPDLLRKALEERGHNVVVLRADTNTSHGDVIHVMDLIRESGAEGLTVAARSPDR